MRRLPWARRIAAVASLGDENRRSLFGYIASSPQPVGRDDAAGALGIPRSTASFQLDKMVQDGLLTVEFRKLRGRGGPGSGRPAKMYRTAQPEVGASVPDRNYDLAGELMATAIEQSAAEGQPVQNALLATSYAKGLAMAEGPKAWTNSFRQRDTCPNLTALAATRCGTVRSTGWLTAIHPWSAP
ncbi:helix-turn-helix transcriptional regulator [Arthrobacter sp. 24S4-2]|uniref:ArsR/SmtB family transcription factor n=1 Tax=Arthrobacter sp. 24S4-2 TaxID=2575374 RepID=UPI0020C81DDC|nr:helix-turn-helix domain-containing protein [Arthrobacter sp. 24S4-2]